MVEGFQQAAFLKHKMMISSLFLGSLDFLKRGTFDEKIISRSTYPLQNTGSKSSNGLYPTYLPNRRTGSTKQCFWLQSLHQFRDFLFFNDVELLAGGFFYGCSGVVVNVWPWEARDGYGAALDFQHELNAGGECRPVENNKKDESWRLVTRSA